MAVNILRALPIRFKQCGLDTDLSLLVREPVLALGQVCFLPFWLFRAFSL